MRKKILKSILFSIFVICGFANSFAQETFSTGLNGWSSAYGSNTPVAHAPSEGVNSDGALQLTRENNNSNFGLNPAGINADTHKIIKFVYKNLTKGTDIRVQGGLASPDNILPTVLSMTPELDQWVTGYLDMTGVAGWSGTVDNFDVLIRKNFAAGEGVFLLDEIEFLTSIPVSTSEYVTNPDFEDQAGLGHYTGSQSEMTRSISTTEFQNGAKSMELAFTGDASKINWLFTDATGVGTYTPAFGGNQQLDITMWVKKSGNEDRPVKITVRTKHYLGTASDGIKPIATETTTPTTLGDGGSWEQLSFTLISDPTIGFDSVTLWIAVDWTNGDPDGTNAKNNDKIYIDNIVASPIVDGPALSVRDNTLENVSFYPNPANNVLNIKTQENFQKVEIFNLLGKKVLVSEDVTNSIDISSLSKSVYLVKLTSDKGVFTKKLLKN